jgi:hypothetical protein
MCARCDRFLERKRVNSRNEYLDLVCQTLAALEEGTLRMLSGNLPLKEILFTKRWRRNHIVHVLGCTTCSRQFRLNVVTSIGCGGAWEVITSRVQRHNDGAKRT